MLTALNSTERTTRSRRRVRIKKRQPEIPAKSALEITFTVPLKISGCGRRRNEHRPPGDDGVRIKTNPLTLRRSLGRVIVLIGSHDR